MKTIGMALLLLLPALQEKRDWKQVERELRPAAFKEVDLTFWPDFRPLSELSGPDALSALQRAVEQPEELALASPIDRLTFQRSLWSFFDAQVRSWIGVDPERLDEHHVLRGASPKQMKPERALQLSSAALRLTVLKPEEVRALPDSYALTVASKAYPDRFDDTRLDQPFLPSDLGSADGPWICLGSSTPIPLTVRHHFYFGGRSAFLVFLRVPAGRADGLKLAEALVAWLRKNPLETDPPELPAGTQVALMEQRLVLTEGGTIAASPLVDAVELRVYRNPKRRFDFAGKAAQVAFLFRLENARFRAGQPALLKAVTLADEDYHFSLVSHGRRDPWNYRSAALTTCASCHNFAGTDSLGFLEGLRKEYTKEFTPRALSISTPAAERDRSIKWKEQQDTGKELKSLWR